MQLTPEAHVLLLDALRVVFGGREVIPIPGSGALESCSRRPRKSLFSPELTDWCGTFLGSSLLDLMDIVGK